MATSLVNPNGDFDVGDTTIDTNGLLGAILGKQVKQNTVSDQATNSSTNSSTANSASASSNQSAATAGSVNTAQSGQQTTDGSTSVRGTQQTTGTINRTNNTAQTGLQTTSSSANLDALNETYARQRQGITPDMLAAIFREGSKAAPQLAVSNANALGARAEGNTPLAASLQRLQLDLTSKAADINRQLLSDSSVTAGKIGELTRNSAVTSSGNTASTGQDVQNLLTATDSQTIAKQIIASINQSAQTSNQLSNTASNQSSNSSSATAGNQAQNVHASENKNSSTTINTNALKGLAGAFAGGVAIDALFRAATGKGFVGNLTDFANKLVGQGANKADVDKWLKEHNYNPTNDSNPDLNGSVGDSIPPNFDPGLDSNPDVNGSVGDSLPPTDDFLDGWADGGLYADGGLPEFLPIEMLIKKQQIVGNPDSDLDGLLKALSARGGSSEGTSTSDGTNPSSNNNSPASGEASDSSGGSAVGNSVGTGTNGLSAGFNSQAASTVLGLVGTALGLPAGAVALGKLGFAAYNAYTNTQAQNEAQLATEAAAQRASQLDTDPSVNGSVSDTATESHSDLSSGNIAGSNSDTDSDSGSASDSDSDSGSSGDSAGGADSFADGGGFNLDGNEDNPPNAAANIGDEDEDPHHLEIMQAIGITKGTERGSLVFNPAAIKRMHTALQSTKAKGYSDGGAIKGKGTGVSDSIPARGPSGRKLQVSNGEFIVPADVVQHFGAESFQELIDTYHVPADMQRAIVGA